jgi:hypothetical protein
MRSALSTIVGLRVSKTGTVHDYVQIAFEDDTMLSIFNPLKCDGTLDALSGRIATEVNESSDEILILFDGVRVAIDMRDDVYAGPEALVLHRSGFPPVVWN